MSGGVGGRCGSIPHLLPDLLLLPFATEPENPEENSRPASGEAAAFRAANRQIDVYRDAVAYGNSPTQLRPPEFSRSP